MFPVYIYDDETKELPQEGSYYVVAGNGWFHHKETQIMHGFTPVKDCPYLPDLNVSAKIGVHLPRISVRLIHQTKEFFKRVLAKHDAESAVILYYNPDTQHYKIFVPKQTVSRASVNYTRQALGHTEEYGGYLEVGTIHSHCDFDAFHSGTDIDDERNFDGIHLTFGHNDKDIFTIACSMTMGNYRVKSDPIRFAKGIEALTDFDPDTGESAFRVTTNQKFRLIAIPEEAQKKWFEELDSWMAKVETHSYLTGFGAAFREPEIRVGDKVRWKPNLRGRIFKELCGYGNYEVMQVSKSSKTLVIQTPGGKARFKREFFEKVQYFGLGGHEPPPKIPARYYHGALVEDSQ